MARGDGIIYLRGNVYWVCYYLRGVQHRESTESANPKTAEKFLKARLREVGADLLGARAFTTPKASKTTIAELCEALKADFELRGKASPQNLSHLKRVETDFGTHRATELTAEQIDTYVKSRLAAKTGPKGEPLPGDAKATVNRTLQMLGQCYALAIQNGTLNRAPHIRHLSEKGNERKGFLNPAEFQNLLAALPPDLKDFCEWGYATGMRKGEASLLRWDMVEGDELRIPGDITKNREARTIPLCGELSKIIERRRSQRQVKDNGTARLVEFIFHRDGASVAEFRKSWRTACKKAGVGGTRYHDLRRSAARNLTQAGVPREIAKQVTGHVSDSMWDRYNIVIVDDVRAALERTEKYRAAALQKVVAMR